MSDDHAAIPKPEPQLEIPGIEALRVIADPLRLRLIEALRQAPSTVKELAALLELPPKSLYYHIGLLERHGLVKVVDSRLVSGILEKTYQATAYLFLYTGLEPCGDQADPRGIQAMTSSIFTITNEEIMEGVRSGLVQTAASGTSVGRTLQSSWQLLRLRPAEAEEFDRRMQALIDEYKELPRTAESRTYRLLSMFFPVHRIEDREPQ